MCSLEFLHLKNELYYLNSKFTEEKMNDMFTFFNKHVMCENSMERNISEGVETTKKLYEILSRIYSYYELCEK